jgi:hypothetical protein
MKYVLFIVGYMREQSFNRQLVWTKGEFVLTDEQRADLQRQADAFCAVIEK